MAYVEKRAHSNGRISYRARVRVRGAPEKSETFTTFRKAARWANRMEVEIRNGRYFGREHEKERTFGEFIDLYIVKELPKNPKSLPKLKMQLLWWRKHLKGFFLCHITPQMIIELRDQLLTEMTPRNTFRSQSTANRYLAALSRAFSICVKEWGWLKESPMKKVSRFQEGKPRERFLSKEEIKLLLAACKKSKSPHLYAVTLFGICTGARKGEILGLKWKDIDFDRSTATFLLTKNGDTRTVPLCQMLLDCLRKERNKRVIMSEYTFPCQDGSKPADIRTSWELAVKNAGIKGISFHTLRHTCASHLSMQGASTLEIAAILGHKSLSMVKRYSHLSVSAKAKVLNRMNDEIFGG
ncbi:MAG: site-specific integrase [Waddliaceae bacterium]